MRIMDLYFAYGSNINMKQMKERCPSATFFSKAIMRDYRLDFPRRSERWGGGVAGITKDESNFVEGVIYELTFEDLLKLDIFEGVKEKRYERKKASVELSDGRSIEVWVYFANMQDGWPFAPSRKYIETILEGAKEHHHLSERLIKHLQSYLQNSPAE